MKLINLSAEPLGKLHAWLPRGLDAETVVFLPDACPGKSPLPTGTAVLTRQPDWRRFAVSDCGCGMRLLRSPLPVSALDQASWDALAARLRANGGGLGDLGGGNHFLDALAPYDGDALHVLVHTGSRAESGHVDALARDHRRRAARAPRALGELAPGPTTAGDLTDPGYGLEECDRLLWNGKWNAAFAGVTKYREQAYLTSIPGTFTFYPGAAVYHGTNTNSKTYLGACNGASQGVLVFEVHRRIGGKWTEVLEVEIDSYEKYTFYSGLPASYRGQTHGANGAVLTHYGVGTAWTLSPPLGIAP